MTQQEKILRYLVSHKTTGMTIRDAFVKLDINCPHKRVSELEQRGIGIRRINVENDKGVIFRKYFLSDPDQNLITELLDGFASKRSPA